MTAITRRDALLGASAAAAMAATTAPLAFKAAGVKAALAGTADPIRPDERALSRHATSRGYFSLDWEPRSS